jgi:hypothetical protein
LMMLAKLGHIYCTGVIHDDQSNDASNIFVYRLQTRTNNNNNNNFDIWRF